MATKVKRESKIGKRIKARQKAGKSTSLAIGPGAVGNIMKGSKMGQALAGTLKKLRDETKARIARRAKTKPVPTPKGVKSDRELAIARSMKLKAETLAKRDSPKTSRLTGDLTKIPKSKLSPADQVRQASQLSRKRVKSGGVSNKPKAKTKSKKPNPFSREEKDRAKNFRFKRN